MRISPFLKATMPRLNSKVGQPQGSSSPRVGLQADKEIADPTKAAPRCNPTRSYVAIAVSGPAHTASPSEVFADRGITLDAASVVPSSKVCTVEEDCDGFKTVPHRKKTTTGAPAVKPAWKQTGLLSWNLWMIIWKLNPKGFWKYIS
jgi:hypothetical protein